jgi:hypothetical protein
MRWHVDSFFRPWPHLLCLTCRAPPPTRSMMSVFQHTRVVTGSVDDQLDLILRCKLAQAASQTLYEHHGEKDITADAPPTKNLDV